MGEWINSHSRLMAPRFETTHWSVVLAAGGDRSQAAADALGVLCETYWYPIYAYIRRQGYDEEDARDLTQSFFALLIERRDVARVRRELGRFRSFLLASARHFLLNDIAHRRTLRQGGGQTVLPLEFAQAERRFLREPVDTNTPERIFDRQWALTVLDRVMDRLRREWVQAERGADFDALKACLTGEKPEGGYAALAAQLHSTESAVKVTVHRLRRRFQRRLREEIAETVATDRDVDDEIQYLLRAIRS
jgi:RNA polymerase sigma-70 factor (ECF subfamily)